jgi:tetratricopeptide (TPR) repeat protein
MRQFYAISLSFLLLTGLFLGCNQHTPKKEKEDDKAPPVVKIGDPKQNPKNIDAPKQADKEKDEKYQAALDMAFDAMAKGNSSEALKAFETARSVDDNEFVKGEIARLKLKVEQQGTTKTTVQNIQTVLDEGKAAEAIKLVQVALKDLGDGDDAATLIKLRLQAEALQGVQKPEDKDARYTRFKKEGETAEEENNLRAAALAHEQALEALKGRDDAALQAKYDRIRENLDKYDALRKKAAELRRDAGSLEDALAALKDAADTWDTLQIRSDIDETKLAMQKRRGSVTVANFDLRNDVGMPGAGVALADKLLPQLQPKFDLVEREQLNRVIGELKIEDGANDELKLQQQLGKLAKVRYLVVGSVSRLVGVTVRARLIDVRSGLIVQTAKISAKDMADAIDQVPELAKQLMMTDEEKLAAEAQPVAEAPKAAPDDGKLPEAPKPLPVNVPPPQFNNIKANAFQVLAPPPAGFVAPDPVPPEVRFRNRLLFATVEAGDYFFQAGRFGDARRQYEFALTLDPNNLDLQVRLERVLPLAPPPFFYVRPRIVVLPFLTQGNPLVVPQSLAYWTPSNLAPYFSSRYEVVDPGIVYWYMARAGITMRDVMENPNARRWLGRAVGVRYFVLGSCVETASFDVNTYLIDTEFGYLQGQATINVRDPYELKLRLPELAQLTMMTFAERDAYLRAGPYLRFVGLVADGRRHMWEGRYREAAAEFTQALDIYPYNVQVQFWLAECQDRIRFLDFTLARGKLYVQWQPGLIAYRDRQIRLREDAERARLVAVAEAGRRSDADNQTLLRFRIQARDSMIVQAQFALRTNRFGISVTLFQSAMDITPRPSATVVVTPVAAIVFQDFAQARLGAERAEQLRVAQITAAREAALRRVREQQLADAQKQLARERVANQAALESGRSAQAARDEAAFNAGIKQGIKLMSEGKHADALAAYQAAQRVATSPKQNESVNNYIQVIVTRQAEAAAKTPQEKAAVEQRLKTERERRVNVEALAKQNEETYKTKLKAAQTALAAKNLELAQAQFEAAKALYKTDAVEAGLQQIKSARAAALLAKQQADADAKKADTVKQLIADGNAAFDAKKYADAVQIFQQAKKLAPTNIDVMTGLTKAEQARDRLTTVKTPDDTQKQTLAQFQTLLATGKEALNGKRYPDALKALASATALMPDNKEAQDLYKRAQAESAQTAGDKQRLADYQAAVNAGQKAYLAKNFDDAIKSYQQALKVMPNDASAAKGLQQAQDAKTASADFTRAMDAGQKAMTAKNYAAAVKAYGDAAKLNPTDADARTQLARAQQAQADADRLTNFQKAMDTGKTAMSGKKYDMAIKSFNDALKIVPGDKMAEQQLRLAQQALADSAKVKTPPVDPAKQFTEAMQRGAAANKKAEYADAVKAYEEATKLRPKDADALAGLKLNQYSVHMQKGQQNLDASMWMAAQTEFEAALRLYPNDQNAQKQLKKAKAKMK